MSLGIALDVLKHWQGNKEVISKPVVEATSTAANWLHDKGEIVSSGIQNGYRDMVRDATQYLQEHAPEALRDSIGHLGQGYGDLGGKVLGFLDPVGYALDLSGDLLDSVGEGTDRKLTGISKLLNGQGEEGAEMIGRQVGSDALLSLQGALTALPAGHLASKVVKKPLKTASKAIKQEIRRTTDTTTKKALKHDLHVKKVQTKIVGRTAKASAIVGKQKARDALGNSRRQLRYRNDRDFPTRDWNQLSVDGWKPLNEEGEELWNRSKWKRR